MYKLKKCIGLMLLFLILASALPVKADDAYSPDNSVKTDPLQSAKQIGEKVTQDEFSGAAIYEYPIDTPQGRNGMTPSVRLTYNSQDSSLDYIAGYRWSLSSYYIQRINKRGVEKMYSQNDFFAVLPSENGELTAIQINEQYGVYGQKTERAFSKYEYKDDETWVVTDRNGVKYTFGTSADDKQYDPNDQSHVYKWMISEIRDTNDNFIKYNYLKADNQIYPKTISYTGHGDENGIFEVQFLPFAQDSTGTKRNDSHLSYAEGFKVETNYMLTGIQVYANNQIKRKYDINHITVNPIIKQTIESITETGYDENGNAKSLPPSTFEYTPSTVSWQETTDYIPNWLFASCSDNCHSTGAYEWDMTGDGLVDYEAMSERSTTERFVNNGNGAWTQAQQQYIGNGSSTINPIPGMSAKDIDFNGDVRTDIVMSYANAWENNKIFSQIKYYNGQFIDNTVPVAFSSGIIGMSANNGASLADLNGDGLPDIIQSGGYLQTTNTCINDNGDKCSLTDLWHSPTPLLGVSSYDLREYPMGYSQDCNYDGLADVYYSGSGAKAWVNDGKGGWTGTADSRCRFAQYDSNTQRTADVNGDGLLDYIKSYYVTTNGPTLYTNQIEINTGASAQTYNNLFPLVFGNLYNTSWSQDAGVRLVDLNGDLLPDVIQSLRIYDTHTMIPTDTKKVYMNKGSRPYFLKTIHNSSGSKIDLQYKTSAQYIKKDGTQANPNLPIIVTTVSQISINDGMGNISSTDYFYEDGHYYYNSPYNKEMAGFRIVTKTDKQGYKTKNYYHQSENSIADTQNGEFEDHISKKGIPYRMEIYDNSGHLLKTSINKYEKTDLSNGRFFPFLKQSISSDYNNSGQSKSVAQAYEYDGYGNPITVIDYGEVNLNDNSGQFSDTGNDLIKQQNTYVKNQDKNILGFTSEQKIYDQNNNLINDKRILYDGMSFGEVIKGNVTETDDWIDTTGDFAKVKIEYNEYGMPVKQTNPRGYYTFIDYDSLTLYPAHQTNALGQIMTSAYNTYGNLISSVDPNGASVKNEYDGLGRLTKTEIINPKTLSFATTKTVSYDDNSMPKSVHQTSYNDNGIEVDSYSYYDGLGRAIETKSEGFNGQFITTASIFDDRGNVTKLLQPYFSGSSGFETIDSNKTGTDFIYDGLNRVISSSNPLGTSYITYDIWNKSLQDMNGNKKDLIYDARGKLITVKEHNGNEIYTTNYTYNPLGALINITDASGNIRDFSFDSLGRMTSQTDVHKSGNTSGLWKYEYDVNSNRIKSSDPLNKVINYTFDALDRLTSENSDGSGFTYTYDIGQYSIGRLSNVAGSGYSRNITYDLIGRAISDEKTIDSKVFATGYDYDLMGGIKSMTYPDGAIVKYDYDNEHMLAKVYDDKRIFADDLKYTPLGQVEQIRLGQKIVTFSNYDPGQMYRLSAKKSLLDSLALQDYQYKYDAIGNLMKLSDRNNSITAKTVDYGYDQLYRLIQANYSGTPNGQNIALSFQYDRIGNMIYKSDIGNYEYKGNDVHAVTKAGDHTYSYDSAGNMVMRDGSGMVYDYKNQMIQTAGNTAYSYDEGGERIKKTNITTGTVKYYPNEYYEVDGDKETKYIFAGSLKIGKIVRTIVEAPSVNEVGDVTDASYTFTGIKSSDLALWVNGAEIMPSGPETEWSYSANLVVGDNNFEFYTKNSNGAESKHVTKMIHYEVTAPTVDFVDSPVSSTRIMLSGTKRANTAIWINNEEVVPVDDTENWQYEVQLKNINNVFEILSKDRIGNASNSIRQEIGYTATAPVVENVVQPVHTNPLTLHGEKIAEMAILINGEEIVSIDNKTDWQASVTLEKGINNFEIKAKNEFGIESSSINLVIPYEINAPSVDAIESPTHETTITLSGTKPPFTGVWINGEEQVKLNDEEVWGYTAELTAEYNTFEIFTKDEAGKNSEKVTVKIQYEAQMPTIDTLPSSVTYSPYTLSGTKTKGTGIWINGTNAVPVDKATVWIYSLPMNTGENTVELWAESGFGVKSEKTSFSLNYQPPADPIINQPNSGGGGGGGGGYSSPTYTMSELIKLRMKKLEEQNGDEEIMNAAKKLEVNLKNPAAIAKYIVKNMSAPIWMLPKNLRPKITPITDVSFKNINVIYNDNKTAITWEKMSREAAKFEIYRSKKPYPASKSASKKLTEIIADGQNNKFIDEHREKGEFIYQIVALNHNGDILAVSIPLTPQIIFVDSGKGSPVNFTNYSTASFSRILIAKHDNLNFMATNNPKNMWIVPKNNFTAGTKINVKFLLCSVKNNGKESCQKVDEKVLDVFVVK